MHVDVERRVCPFCRTESPDEDVRWKEELNVTRRHVSHAISLIPQVGPSTLHLCMRCLFRTVSSKFAFQAVRSSSCQPVGFGGQAVTPSPQTAGLVPRVTELVDLYHH